MKTIEKYFYDILLEQAEKEPGREAVVMGDEKLSYKDFILRIDGVSSFLLNKGLKKGDKVALWSSASPAWLYAYYGIIRSGGVALLLNANLTVKDAGPLIEFAETKFILFGKTHDTKGESGETGAISEAFGISEDRCASLNDTDFRDISLITPDMTGWSVYDDATIIYTSGTTAFPKAVVNSQYSAINLVDRISDEISQIRGKKALIGIPFFHIYALTGLWIYLSTGGTVYIPESVKPDIIAELTGKYSITDIWTVAVIYQAMIDNEELAEKAAPTARLCTLAGSYTSPIQFMRFETSFNNATFLNLYGMTETTSAFVLTRPGDDTSVRYNTVGRPIDDIEAEVWDENGILPPGEVGEIITRGYHLKNRYFKMQPDKQAVDGDGWLHSGDLGVFDENRNLKIVGRIKDLIIKGGENIAPSEIETLVMSHPSVGNCRVFGYKDRIYGENIGACVTLAPGAVFDEAEVRRYVKEKIGSYKSPVYYFVFDSFPLNANGKINQRELHIEMLRRLHRLLLEDKLEKGIQIITMSVKNSMFNITPVAAMFEECSINLGFSRNKALKIRQAVEELLLLRINETSDDIGDIDVALHYYQSFLRITVTDCGLEIDPSADEQQKMAFAIMLNLADDCNMERLDDGRYQVRLDFTYDKDFSITDFLLRHEKIE